MTQIKIAQGNVNVICELIAEISGNVKSPTGDTVPVKITTAKGNTSWFVVVEGGGQKRSMKFESEEKMNSMVESQTKFFV